MPAIVKEVLSESIAEDLGISSGDELVSVNGQKPEDYIDYQFLTSGEEVTIHIKHKNGEEELFEIEKDFDDELGMVFESAVFDKIKPCLNKCIFCFVDQQPKGLRKTLYIKDDDYRLSYLQGTYVTLTNLTKKDRERLENLRLGPLYVSVHTTNPELRVKMLKNPNAGGILKELKWLDSLEIPVHTQIVLCPNYNDGNELIRTLNDLSSLKNVLSVAIVPVGVTKYRDGVHLEKVDEKIALEVINAVEEFNKNRKTGFAQASDEFYILAKKPFPKEKYYNNYAQLEDGVGTSRMLLENFKEVKKALPKKIKNKKKIVFATGLIAVQTLEKVSKELNKIENLTSEVIGVKSDFWGEDITVSGLITGSDLIGAFKNSDKNFELIISSVMLKSYTETFLDDLTVSDVSKELGVKINVIQNPYGTEELIEIINS